MALSPLTLARSPVGKKVITGLTGLILATFVLLHMVGNLLMFVGPAVYNRYGYFIECLGPVFWLLELGLLAVVLIHAGYGLHLYLQHRRSRPIPYAQYASKGAPSLQSLSSRTMIVTGSLMGIFIVSHLLTFKFGPYYTTVINGQEMRDLARLVVEVFQKPVYVLSYTAVVAFLGFHLRHGVWSGLQSLGAMATDWKPLIYGFSLILAGAIALGFGLLPWAVYLGVWG